MRTRSLSVIALFTACTSSSGRPRTEIQYSEVPGTNDCVADPGTPDSNDWERCQPPCMDDRDCSTVCPALACDGRNDPGDGTAGDGTNSDPGVDCPNGYVIDERGCPTCECYDRVCPDGTPAGENGCPCGDGGEEPGSSCADITDETRCRAANCEWIALGEPCNSGETCREGVCQDPAGSPPCPDGTADCNGTNEDPSR